MNGSKYIIDPVFRNRWLRWLAFLTTGLILKFITEVIFVLIYRNYDLFQSVTGYLLAAFLALVGLECFRVVIIKLNKKIEWDKKPYKRLTLELTSIMAITLLVVVVVRWAFILVFTGFTYVRLADELLITILSLLLALGVMLIDLGIFLFRKWRLSIVEMEKHKKESAEFQFETLRAQVNPHFLFNSLNTLSSLVYQDPDKAELFIRELSDVYRYILETRNKELVSMEQELKFLESFLFLLKIRFGNNLDIKMDVPDSIVVERIAPLTLQLLIENAVKHNIISSTKPLTISIFIEDGSYLVVSNNLQKKQTETYSSAMGLKNISSRYHYLTQKQVFIFEDEASFTVKVPLI